MGKVVFWVGVVAVIWAVIRFIAIVQRRQASQRREPPGAASRPAREKLDEPMLRCAHCGVYFPASEAVRRGAKTYCSAEHVDASA